MARARAREGEWPLIELGTFALADRPHASLLLRSRVRSSARAFDPPLEQLVAMRNLRLARPDLGIFVDTDVTRIRSGGSNPGLTDR